LRFSVSVIARLGSCVAIALKWNIVILNPSLSVILSVAKNLNAPLRINSVKNLIESMPYKTEILRLKPQNDIVTQSLDLAIQKKELDLEPAPYLIRGSSRIMTTIGTEFTMNIKQESHAIYKIDNSNYTY